MNSTISPFARPLYVMLKPIGAHCNLACDYCYYLEKAKLYDDVPKHVMSEELLEEFVRQYIGAQTMSEVLFTWHGGETLMRSLSFYKKAMELQRKYAVSYSFRLCTVEKQACIIKQSCSQITIGEEIHIRPYHLINDILIFLE